MNKQIHSTELKKILPFGILLLAFLLQMQYLAELRIMFPNAFGQPFCGVDAIAYANRATGLLDGSIPGANKPFYFIPLYPLYLAILNVLLGNYVLLPIFFQALLQIIGIAALYTLGRMVFSPLVGALAALGMATYNYYIFYLPCFDQSLLTTPFFTLALCWVIKYDLSQKSGWLFAGGVALAIAILSRPTLITILPVIIIWLYFTRHNSRNAQQLGDFIDISPQTLRALGRDIIFLTLPFIIAVAPITWHNYQATGRFILVSDNFGVNIFTGNNPDASGLDTLAHIQGQPAELRFRETLRREQNGETTLAAEALKYIINQPDDWLALMTTKTWLWFGEVDERLVAPVFPVTVQQSQILSGLPLEWQALAVAALLGLLLVRGRSRSQTAFLWLVYGVFSLFTILFFIQLRFRLPLIPFALLLAASLLASARRWHDEQTWRFWLTLVVLLILFPLIPALWIFIIFFSVYGLFPTSPSTLRLELKRKSASLLLLFAIGCYLLLGGIWIKAEKLATDTSQTIDHYLGPPLAANEILGQTFQMDCNKLNRIEVTLGTFNNKHDQPVAMYLATDLTAQNIIYTENFEGASIEDHDKKVFIFDPIPNSAGQTFFLFLNLPTSTPETGITVRGFSDTPIDHYPAGSAFAGQIGTLQQVQADFAFAAYCDLTLWEKLQGLFEEF
jgi:hypothetical protein